MASQSGVENDALNASGTAATQAATAAGTAIPLFQQLATHPTGMTPQQMSDARTSAEQGVGGGVAAAVGQGGLMAARTGNAGGATAALDDASRQGMVQDSTNNLNITNANTALEQQQMQEGLQGLSGIYNEGTNASISALNAANGSKTPFWQQLAQTGLGDVKATTSF